MTPLRNDRPQMNHQMNQLNAGTRDINREVSLDNIPSEQQTLSDEQVVAYRDGYEAGRAIEQQHAYRKQLENNQSTGGVILSVALASLLGGFLALWYAQEQGNAQSEVTPGTGLPGTVQPGTSGVEIQQPTQTEILEEAPDQSPVVPRAQPQEPANVPEIEISVPGRQSPPPSQTIPQTPDQPLPIPANESTQPTESTGVDPTNPTFTESTPPTGSSNP
ncbi:MAG: hypothetical protein HC835_09300 [Oscillatoriales cyanobacterium RM2_1_1]|nr:hypothetical protein [Oscillatoriales cyanobacterium SM2_3_0]NJO45803.1 hypothetical protein [Oscillatoriales cyanobacterium RM2_1_1]